MKIRYLSQQEKQSTRAMYEAIFTEDSEAFVNYYYHYKTLDNEILVMEENGSCQVMMHLNPFVAVMNQEAVSVRYIVAVATDISARRQGKMAEVMKRALQDMYEKHQPFTFLMPANPPVYYSTGFRFLPEINKRELWAEPLGQLKDSTIMMEPLRSEEWEAAAALANRVLAIRAHLYLQRDRGYYERLVQETKSEGGGVYSIQRQGRMVGLLSCGSNGNTVEMQELLCLEEEMDVCIQAIRQTFQGMELEITDMRFMARILDLKILGLLLKSEEEFCLRVRVTDNILHQNNGCFEIRADAKGSSISRIEVSEVECDMEIGELAELLFGKMKVFLREWV